MCRGLARRLLNEARAMIAFDRMIAGVFRRRGALRLCGLFIAASASVAAAQDPTPGADLPTDARASGAAKPSGTVFIPVLGAGPTFGLGGGAVASRVFTMDAASPRSGIGVGGF